MMMKEEEKEDLLYQGSLETQAQAPWYWCKEKNVDEWNRIETSEIAPYTQRDLLYSKR